MPQPPVAPDIHKTLDVHGGLGAKGTLYLVLPFDLFSEEVDFLIVQILGPATRIHSTGIQNLFGPSPPDPIDIGQGYLNPFASRQINTRNTCHQFVSVVLSTE